MTASNKAELPEIQSPSPAKAIIRKGSKRTARVMSDDSLAAPATTPPRKKRKAVAFSDASPVVHEIKPRTRKEVRAEVERALQRAATEGDKEDYEILRAQFQNLASHKSWRSGKPTAGADGSVQEQELGSYLHALAERSHTLKDRMFRDLVKAVLDANWVGRDDDFVSGYTHFLVASASHGKYLVDCLEMVFDWFYDSRSTAWAVPGCPKVGRKLGSKRLHKALWRIVQVSAAATKIICDLARRKYPNDEENKRVHVTYATHLLKIIEYVPPAAGRQLQEIILERLSKLDVAVQVDFAFMDADDELAFAVRRAMDSDVQADGDGSGSDAESDEEIDDDHEGLQQIKSIKNRVYVMDAMMGLLLDYYNQYFDDPESTVAETHFNILLSQFSSALLRMRRTRHVQFLLFHFAQKSEKLMNLFITTCGKDAFGRTVSEATDLAVSYLAGFVTRGTKVPSRLVRQVFDSVLKRLEQRRLAHEGTCRGPSRERYRSYYTLFQAAMYIFCFRWQDLIEWAPADAGCDPEDPLSYVQQDLEWGAATTGTFRSNALSPLNPLKVCSQHVVAEFSLMAFRLNLVYVLDKVEANKRVRLYRYARGGYLEGASLRDDVGGHGARDDVDLQLDDWYPFNPYQLPDTRHWFDDDYLEWQPVRGLHADVDKKRVANDEEDLNSDEEEEDDDDDDDDESGDEDDAVGCSVAAGSESDDDGEDDEDEDDGN